MAMNKDEEMVVSSGEIDQNVDPPKPVTLEGVHMQGTAHPPTDGERIEVAPSLASPLDNPSLLIPSPIVHVEREVSRNADGSQTVTEKRRVDLGLIAGTAPISASVPQEAAAAIIAANTVHRNGTSTKNVITVEPDRLDGTASEELHAVLASTIGEGTEIFVVRADELAMSGESWLNQAATAIGHREGTTAASGAVGRDDSMWKREEEKFAGAASGLDKSSTTAFRDATTFSSTDLVERTHIYKIAKPMHVKKYGLIFCQKPA